MATSTNARWYEEDEDNVHTTLAQVFRLIRDEAEWRVDADEYHAGLYAASDRPGVKGASRRGYEYGPATLPYNVCRAATDTLTAKIAKHRPLPQCLTQRGSWKNQKRARKMTQFLEGEFYRQRVFERWAKFIIRDACVFGRGILKVWDEGENIEVERVHPWELFVDEWDARYGMPRNIYHCRTVDKGVLIELFAKTSDGRTKSKLKDAIESAGQFAPNEDWADRSNATVDRVDVIEAWHLPSRKGAKDGRHVVIVEGATLLDEKWTLDYFPFAVLNYSEPLSGYFGHGLIEQVEGYQYEINKTSEKLSQQYHMSGVGILVPDGSNIHDQQIRNGINIVRHKAGMRPEVFQMDLVNEHLRARPRELTEDALNDCGLSQMSVQSQKPAGITAGIAIQTLDDIETERFIVFGRAYEAWCLEVARRFIDCAKRIADEYGDLAVSVPMKGGMLELSWNDVYVDGVEIKVFPTSLLPQQLGARMERLIMLFNTGLVDRSTFLRHLDAPDMQAELDLETADKLVIDEILEAMLDAEEDQGEAAYFPPSAYQDLEWAAKRAQQKLNRATLDGAPEFNRDLLRRYIEDCDEELAKLTPPPAPTGPGPALAEPAGMTGEPMPPGPPMTPEGMPLAA